MKRIFLLHTPFTALTGRNLASRLNAQRGINCDHPERYDAIVRWGSSRSIGTSTPLVINRKQAILNTADKENMLKLFKKYGVSTPKFYLYNEFSTISRFPVVVRYKQHTQGTHFHICNSSMEAMNYAKPGYHAIEIVQKDKEYRVFVWKDRVLEVNRKTRDDEETARDSSLIRNFKHGWWFKVVKYYDERIISEAIKATKSMGLDFGAVDICLTTSGEIKVFEINSAPGLFERKAELVAETIREYIDSEVV